MELSMPGRIEGNDLGEVGFEIEQGIFHRERSDGSSVDTSADGRLKKVVTSDGVSADINDNCIVIINPRTGENIEWSSKLMLWTSSSPRFPGTKTDVKINEKCEISFTAQDGSRHMVGPDGREHTIVSRRDGVELVLNERNQLTALQKETRSEQSKELRTAQLQKVVDKNKDSERLVFDRRTNDGIASVELSNNGDLLVRRLDNTSILEGADFTSVLAAQDGSPLQVTNQRGDTRVFKWSGEGLSKTLTENFMFHAMEPTTIELGPASSGDDNGHGTCWITTGEIWGMTQHPGAMADYLKQICLDGRFMTKNSGEGSPNPRTFTFSRALLTFDGRKQESKWSIEDATTMWRETPNMKMQIIGDRSPVNKIFQYTLPMLSGGRREFDVDGGMYETANIVGQGHTRGVRDILFMVTSDTPVDKSGPGHPGGHLLKKNQAECESKFWPGG
jgi:hypothetical protein